MNSSQLGIVLRRLEGITLTTAPTDAELLARYQRGEQAAFAELVARYSGLVWSVGRRTLCRQQDGEDVFQATFLALSRQSHSLKGEHSLAPWLYKVAARLALKIKRRQRHERRLMTAPEPATLTDPSAEVSGRELTQAFDEEVARLPAKYREAVVLCCLEGLSRDEAAGAARCTLGAMKNRLERGRKLLRKRLERRGVAVPATLLLVGLSKRGAPAAVCAAACRIDETASPGVAALAREAMGGSMMLKAIALTVALGLATIGIGIGESLFADQEPEPKTPPAAQAQQPDKETKPPKDEGAKETKSRLDRFGDPLPEEALARFGTVRLRVGHISKSLFSPDGKTMAIAGAHQNTGTLGIWDIASGKELFRFVNGGGDRVKTFDFSPDGKMLAVSCNRGKNNSTELWDAQSGKLIRDLQGNVESNSAMVFAPDGKTLITGAGKGTIRFWDVASGEETAKIEKHRYAVWALAVSKDGKQLASSDSGVVRVWDVKSRELLKELKGDHDQIRYLSFSPNGKNLASTTFWGPSVLWDVTKGEPVCTWDVVEKKEADELEKAMARLGEGVDRIGNIAFSPDGKWLVAGWTDGTIRFCNPETGKEVRRWKSDFNPYQGFIFSNDSKVIVTTAYSDSTVRFWDVETGKEINPSDVHRGRISELTLSPDGKLLWSLSADRHVIRWNTASAQLDERIAFPSEEQESYWMSTLSSGGNFLAWCSDSEKTIHIVDLKTRKEASTPLKIEADPGFTRFCYLRFSPDGKILAAGSSSSEKIVRDGKVIGYGPRKELIHLWKWQTDRNVKSLRTANYDRNLPVFTPDSKQLVILSHQDRRLDWWDVITGQKARSFPNLENPSGFRAVSPDGRWIISRDDRQHIRVIDVEKRKMARNIRVAPQGPGWPPGEAGAWTVVFSPDGRLLALAEDNSLNSNVQLIEFASGETVTTFKGHHSGVHALQFTPDDRMLYSGGGDSTILKWDATGRHGKGASSPSSEAAWAALAKDANKAYPAVWDLVDAPTEAVSLLRKRVTPEKVDAKEYQRLVDDLNAEEFAKREKASGALKSLAYSAESLLRRSLETEKRPEVKERLQKLIDELEGPSFLRIQRALQVLETIGNADARRLLQELADGVPESMLTKEAVMVLKRMAK